MPRYWEILDIAEGAIDTLKVIGVDNCCFIGGMACKLYTLGKGRQPKVQSNKHVYIHTSTDRTYQDLDILCITPYPGGAEAIKQRLCQENDRFYTVKAKNPKDLYRVLYWRTGSDEPGFERFKVDILVPGVLDLPFIHSNYVIKINQLPCAPLTLLILHKLKGWNDRRRSRRPHFRAKLPADVRDIVDLLWVANNTGLNITKPRPYISQAFRTASYNRVWTFSRPRQHPEYGFLWMGLGLSDPTGLL